MAQQWSGTGSNLYARKRQKRGRYGPSRMLSHPKEVKWHDGNFDLALVQSSGHIDTPQWPLIAQAVTESARIGRKVTVTSINFRYILENVGVLDSSVTQSQDIVRIIVYLDKQANGAIATVTDLLETASVLSFRNLHNVDRFQFLMDRTHDVKNGSAAGNSSTSDYGRSLSSFTWFKKCSVPLEYTGTAGLLSEMTSNNVGAMVISEINSATTLSSQYRLRYTDM